MVPAPVSAANVDDLGDTAADADTVLRALVEPRRRHVLTVLADSEGPLSLDELATRVVAKECDRDESERSEVVQRTLLISLYHTHAPLLSDADLVAFDADERTVAITDLGRDVRRRIV